MAVNKKAGKRSGMKVLLGGALLLAASGCPATPHAVIGPDGQVIRREYVDAIINNPQLSEEEKRQALRDLGISDESLVDLLLQMAP